MPIVIGELPKGPLPGMGRQDQHGLRTQGGLFQPQYSPQPLLYLELTATLAACTNFKTDPKTANANLLVIDPTNANQLIVDPAARVFTVTNRWNESWNSGDIVVCSHGPWGELLVHAAECP